MLADGAVLHILDYLRFDCPENQGSYITIEALSRYVTNFSSHIGELNICIVDRQFLLVDPCKLPTG